MNQNILITGGAGFIGTNTAEYYLKSHYNVFILDNFERRGTRENIKYLRENYKNRLQVVNGDIRKDKEKIATLVGKSDIIFHFAGQTAVTTSVINPRADFETNAAGTLNLLEAVRESKKDPIFIYSSSNKVYGNLETLKIKKKKTRYELSDFPQGISEAFPLDFHSPYGCSKGAADQYVRDYHRIYGLRTIVFRQSCIYGPHQMGIEDQGWVAWFIIALLRNRKIKIYGDGRQVRDILYIGDLIEAYDAAIKNINITQGQIYNIGGGQQNSISIGMEFKPILERLFGKKIEFGFADIRPGDQKVFITDGGKSMKDFGWKPKVGKEEGIEKIYTWLKENRSR